MSQTKVIFFHPYFHNGGVEKSILRLIKGFARADDASNIECQILTFNARSNPSDTIKEYGATFHELPGKRLLTATVHLIRHLRKVQKNNPDARIILISNQCYVNVASVFSSFFIHGNFRLILSERLHYGEMLINCSRLKQWLIPMLMRLSYRFADKVIANSEDLARNTSELCHVNCTPIANPVIDESLEPLTQPKPQHRWFTPEYKTIISAGRLEKVKGFDTLLNAFKLIHENCDNARLIILGEGSLEDALKSQAQKLGIADFVEFTGFCDNPYPWFAAADLFILSSRYEGLPNVLIEALACNTPAISTDCPTGPREILQEDNMLIKPESHTQMAELATRMLTDNNFCQQMFTTAQNGLPRYKADNVIANYIKLFSEL